MADRSFSTIRPQPTGSTLVIFRPDVAPNDAISLIHNVAGTTTAKLRAAEGAFSVQGQIAGGSAVFIERFGIAVVPAGDRANAASLATAFTTREEVEHSRPEFYLFSLNDPKARRIGWVRQGLHLLVDAIDLPQPTVALEPDYAAAAQFEDTEQMTWGVFAVGCDRSPFLGKGIRIAVLDTGFDESDPGNPDPKKRQRHPDFAGRTVVSETFVPNESEKDVQGHGTHCIGTAAGPLARPTHPRYGVAPDAEIYVGKVLDNTGSGAESWILAGINWAIENQCSVISLSLGRPTRIGEEPEIEYERVGQRAKAAGCLLIAAAGNDSYRRADYVAPVGSPANANSIMAVASLDANLRVANTSCAGINPGGGEVNIAGPGVAVLSSVPMPQKYKRLQGTSMATPHVAGVAALWAESDRSLRGQALWDRLLETARYVGPEQRDYGRGLVQAPAPTTLTASAARAAPLVG